MRINIKSAFEFLTHGITGFLIGGYKYCFTNILAQIYDHHAQEENIYEDKNARHVSNSLFWIYVGQILKEELHEIFPEREEEISIGISTLTIFLIYNLSNLFDYYSKIARDSDQLLLLGDFFSEKGEEVSNLDFNETTNIKKLAQNPVTYLYGIQLSLSTVNFIITEIVKNKLLIYTIGSVEAVLLSTLYQKDSSKLAKNFSFQEIYNERMPGLWDKFESFCYILVGLNLIQQVISFACETFGKKTFMLVNNKYHDLLFTHPEKLKEYNFTAYSMVELYNHVFSSQSGVLENLVKQCNLINHIMSQGFSTLFIIEALIGKISFAGELFIKKKLDPLHLSTNRISQEIENNRFQTQNNPDLAFKKFALKEIERLFLEKNAIATKRELIVKVYNFLDGDALYMLKIAVKSSFYLHKICNGKKTIDEMLAAIGFMKQAVPGIFPEISSQIVQASLVNALKNMLSYIKQYNNLYKISFADSNSELNVDLSIKLKDKEPILINFILEKGSVCLVKAGNGTGKSTFLKILNRYIPDFASESSGKVEIPGDVSMITTQNFPLSNMTIKDFITLGKSLDPQLKNDIKKILESNSKTNHFKLDSNLEELKPSDGQFAILKLFKALADLSKIVIIDEALATLDKENLQICYDLMQKYLNKAIVFIVGHNQKFDQNFTHLLQFNPQKHAFELFTHEEYEKTLIGHEKNIDF